MSPNAKKVLIGTALIVGLIIWRGYNTNKTSALQDFTKNYNIYLNNEKRFFHYVAEQSEPGPVPQAEIMMPLTYSVNFLATTDDGCHRIPDKALADECSSAFADYHNVLTQVEKNGLTEERMQQVLAGSGHAHGIAEKLAVQFPEHITRQSN